MTRRHLSDTTTTAALRQLDPAGPPPGGQPQTLTTAERDHADATLRQIVTSGPTFPSGHAQPSANPHDTSPQRPSPPNSWSSSGATTTGTTPRVRRRRLLLGLGAALVAAVFAVSGPVWNRNVAYASWTPVPVVMSPAESATAVDVCLTAYQQSRPNPPAPLIAERRGGWAYVLIPLPANIETSCIMPTDALRAGNVLRGGQFFGGTGDHPPLRPSPRHLYRLVSGVGNTDEGMLAYTEGEVGRDVVAVTITTPRGVRVVASVANGRYAAWWPAGKNTLTNPEISGASLYDLTLRDGTTSREPPR